MFPLLYLLAKLSPDAVFFSRSELKVFEEHRITISALNCTYLIFPVTLGGVCTIYYPLSTDRETEVSEKVTIRMSYQLEEVRFEIADQ